MKYDLVVDYAEVYGDKVVNVLLKNVKASSFQISLTQTVLAVVNLVSPVKINVTIE